jgi:hypothetical protein
MEIENILNELIIWLKDRNNLWIKDFAHSHNISFVKLQSESLKNENTKELLQIVLEIQESKLIKLALNSDLNSKVLNSILENINKSPASLETNENKPVPCIQFYLKEPPNTNDSENKINSNSENNVVTTKKDKIDSS